METLNMTYNSELEGLTIPEYGRNVQELIKHCKTIEDKEVRQNTAIEIVALMSRMNAPTKMTSDFNLKLWKHFIIIAEYNIDIDLPKGVTLDKDDEEFHPDKPDYPVYLSKFRHYGHSVKKLVEKAKNMENGDMKDQFFRIIGSYMKLAYRTWNSKHYVSDEIIKEDLSSMTDNEVKINSDVPLDFHTHINKPVRPQLQNPKRRRKPPRSSNGGRHKSNNNRQRRR